MCYVTAVAAGWPKTNGFILKWVILIINGTKPPILYTKRKIRIGIYSGVGIFNWYYPNSTPRGTSHPRGLP
jgi:hypothetical protein